MCEIPSCCNTKTVPPYGRSERQEKSLLIPTGCPFDLLADYGQLDYFRVARHLGKTVRNNTVAHIYGSPTYRQVALKFPFFSTFSNRTAIIPRRREGVQSLMLSQPPMLSASRQEAAGYETKQKILR